ncbi:GyrI-like domain-containing protein [bacterium]|nr:GyrI-like domain-containing protein [bacterium]
MKIKKMRWVGIAVMTSLALSVSGQDAQKAVEKPVPAVQVRDVAPFMYAALEMTGSYEQHSQAFQDLYQNAGAQGVAMDQPPFGLYFNNPENTPQEQLKWDLGLPCSEEAKLTPPLKLKKWEFDKIAVLTYTGNYEADGAQAHHALFQWIGENKYVPAGPVMEKFLSMPVADEKGQWSGTVEVSVPVQAAP